jgi:hypothetical protein
MGFVRQQVIQRFPSDSRVSEEEQLATALYFLLWSIEELEVSVDGWSLLQVVRESDDSLDAVGLMTLLPNGSIPMAISVRAAADGIAWSAQVAVPDQEWDSLSHSKRWNSVYLHATGDRGERSWTWGRQYQGVVRHAGA